MNNTLEFLKTQLHSLPENEVSFHNKTLKSSELKYMVDELKKGEMFEQADIVLVDEPFSVVNKDGLPIDLVSMKLDEFSKFKGKCFIYSFHLIPGVYNPEDLSTTIDGGLVTPLLYNPVSFNPYRKIILDVGPDITDRESLIKQFNEVLDNIEHYSPKPVFHVIIRGLFDACSGESGEFTNMTNCMDSYQITDKPKFKIIHYVHKLFIGGNEYSITLKKEALPNEYLELFEDEFNLKEKDRLLEDKDIEQFFRKHNIKLTFNELGWNI